MLLTILVFLVILSVLVLIHEAGHFFVAKKLGIKVEEFGFGFPPRLFGIKKGETLYSINMLPIGGFVKLYGEDNAGGGSLKITKDERLKDEKHAFYARPVRQRAAVVVAGVVMNALLAVVIFYIFLGLVNFQTPLPCIGDSQNFLLVQKTYINEKGRCDVVISDVAKNSPAEKIGITPGSKILSVNNETVADPDLFAQEINNDRGKPVTISWQNSSNEIITKNVVPRVSPPKGEGALGVAFPLEGIILSYQTPVEKIFSGFTHPINILIVQYRAIQHLVQIFLATRNFTPIANNVAGPVGIGSAVGTILSLTILKEKIIDLLNLAGLLSISLAFFNVLPIPALDGGRLFFILVEGVTRRKVNAKFEGYTHMVGMVILLILVLLVTLHDVLKAIPSIPQLFGR